jgi:hypothetical protein
MVVDALFNKILGYVLIRHSTLDLDILGVLILDLE